MGYSLWSLKELDTTERLRTALQHKLATPTLVPLLSSEMVHTLSVECVSI